MSRAPGWYEEEVSEVPAELNEPQLQAVTHVDGPLLVFAGAGSGKTRVITYRVAHLVATHGVAPYRILSVTFTNKAAQEMRARLVGLLGPSVAGDLWVGTFHATCAKLLRRHHDAVGLGRDFVIYDDGDQKSLVQRILREQKVDEKKFTPRIVLGRIHAHKQEGLGPEDLGDEYVDRVVRPVFAQYEKSLRDSNACDFDDLLLHVLRMLEARPSDEDELTFPPPPLTPLEAAGAALRRKFEYVLVDEFQDTNSVQYRLVRALAPHGNLAVVGDDDQSIYSWRGADVRNIRGFVKDFPEARVVRLEQNYRSTQRIVRAALAVVSRSKDRVPKDLWTENEEGTPLVVRTTTGERDEAQQVAETLLAFRRDGLVLDEMAVLYRTHAQSRVLEEAMRSARLPYRVFGGQRFFERAEVKDLLAYLRLVVNPRSDVDFLRIVNVPPRGIGATTVERLVAAATREELPLSEALPGLVRGTIDSDLPAGARRKLAVFQDLLDGLGRTQAAGALPSELAQRALDDSGYATMLEDEDTDESASRLENVRELVGSIAEWEQAHEAPSLAAFLEETALVTAGDERTARDADAVTLMTVHAAKGLEYRAVVLTGLEEDLFPYRREGEQEDIEEERRLAYVAITRAKERLVLTHATSRVLFGQVRPGRPSRFLTELPREDFEHVRYDGWIPPSSRSGPPSSYGPSSYGPSSYGSSYGPSSYGPRGTSQTPPSSMPRSQPFAHPQRPSAPARAEGERFVERDEHVHLDHDDVHHDPVDDHGDDRAAGRRVRHRKFGEGVLVEWRRGPEPKIVARFPKYGTLTIDPRFVEVVE
ncbi:MAG: UvrD-helicase domain-containing protein [Myxococcales bacterium]|nr:UvrD-helicase domain-containing protein [Myxococcales bacterium]